MAFTATPSSTSSSSPSSVAPSSNSLPKSKENKHMTPLSLSDGQSSTPPRILVKPPSPNPNFYKRVNFNRLRSKSGDGGDRIDEESTNHHVISQSIDTEDQEKYQEKKVSGEECGRGDELSVIVDTVAATPLQSPNKRVTFVDRSKLNHHQYHSADHASSFDQQSSDQTAVQPKRRVRKSKTLDPVDVRSSDKHMPPRSPVMGFFYQIRSVSNAPWRSSPTSSGIASADPFSSSAKPKYFTFRNFTNFLQQQSQQQERKTSRQQNNNVEHKEKRKRTRSYSFRAPSWLNVNRLRAQQTVIRPQETTLKPIIRRRSISANNLPLMASNERVGLGVGISQSLKPNGDVFHDILSHYNCYDLMPQQGVVIGLDCQYTGRQALHTLASNDARVALVCDAGGPIGILTSTDILRLIADHKMDAGCPDEAVNGSQHEQEDILGQPLATSLYASKQSTLTVVSCEASLRTALSLLLGNRRHRLPVINLKTGDVLYFLSKESVLHFLMNHISGIPTPMDLMRPLEETRLGTWTDEGAGDQRIVHALLTDTLDSAVHKLLRSRISSLPVLRQDGHLLAALDKCEFLHFLASFNLDQNSNYRDITVEEFVRERQQGTENLTSCAMDTPFHLAIEMMIRKGGSHIYIVDSDGKMKGVITISDILSYFVARQ